MASRATGSAYPRRVHHCADNALQERPFEFGQQEGVLIYDAIGVVVRHEFVEAAHQALDVYEPVPVAIPLGFKQPAGRGKSAHFLDESIVSEVVDEERRVGDESPRASGAGDENVAR